VEWDANPAVSSGDAQCVCLVTKPTTLQPHRHSRKLAGCRDVIDAPLPARARVRGVSNYAVGYKNDVEAATRHGIMVGNTPGVLTHATPITPCCLSWAPPGVWDLASGHCPRLTCGFLFQ
jgi:hypothetical protein